MPFYDIIKVCERETHSTQKRVVWLKEVTKQLINDFKIKEVGHDFMAYKLKRGDIYTFHHLLVPNREGGPREYWNGAILTSTSHRYLHIIEAIEYEYFLYLTSEMQDMKVKGFLDESNLREIDYILSDFEDKYKDYHTKKRKKLLHPDYLDRKKWV